jgi:hypothetical protein
MKYYVFDTEQQAIDAESYISNIAGFPSYGVNAQTGIVDKTAQKTTNWAIPYQRINDNKWIIPRVPSSSLEQIPQSVIDTFNNDYPHTIEEQQSNWYPAEEL